MSQHDMDIANASGATVRADVTNALKALASTSIGNSAPPTPYTGQSWIDNNTPSATVWTWFVYDGADWIALAYVDSINNVVTPVTVTFASLDTNLIADATGVVPAVGDRVLGMDASDSNNSKSFLATYGGAYTPTVTGVTNVAAVTAFSCIYTVFGDTVLVSGKFEVDPTAAGPTATEVAISLPIASNFTAPQQCNGTAVAIAINGECAGILADTALDRASVQFMAANLSNRIMHFTFHYVIV